MIQTLQDIRHSVGWQLRRRLAFPIDRRVDDEMKRKRKRKRRGSGEAPEREFLTSRPNSASFSGQHAAPSRENKITRMTGAKHDAQATLVINNLLLR